MDLSNNADVKTTTLSVRIESHLVDSLNDIAEKTHIERASLVRSLLEAVKVFYDEHGYLEMPLTVICAKSRRQDH